MAKPLICEFDPPVNDTLVGLFEELRGDPDEPAITYEHLGITRTWKEFDDRVRRLASALKDMGVERGDRVAALLDNGPASVEAWFATMALGAIWVPANTALRGTFLSHVLKDCRAEIVFSEADLIARINDVIGDLPDVKTIIRVADSDVAKAASDDTVKGCDIISIDELRKASPLQSLYKPRPNELAAFIYTSGTTGPSKECPILEAKPFSKSSH